MARFSKLSPQPRCIGAVGERRRLPNPGLGFRSLLRVLWCTLLVSAAACAREVPTNDVQIDLLSPITAMLNSSQQKQSRRSMEGMVVKEKSDKRYRRDFPSYGLENSWEIVNGGCGRLYEGIYYSSRLQMLYASSTLTSQV